MDLLGYAAFSGIERVAIIAGALIVGYWGYRLYGRDKAPGLIFMGIACVVLIASLATGGSHMRSVGASYQLAGAASGSEAHGEPVVEVTSIAPEDVATPDPSEPSPFLDTQMDGASTSAELSPQPADATTQTDAGEGQAEPSAMVATAPEAADPEPAEPAAAPSSAENSASEIALASSRELGGRIVSIKSENLTLEWSNESDEEAAQ